MFGMKNAHTNYLEMIVVQKNKKVQICCKQKKCTPIALDRFKRMSVIAEKMD
jgi:hypothetical protein